MYVVIFDKLFLILKYVLKVICGLLIVVNVLLKCLCWMYVIRGGLVLMMNVFDKLWVGRFVLFFVLIIIEYILFLRLMLCLVILICLVVLGVVNRLLFFKEVIEILKFVMLLCIL